MPAKSKQQQKLMGLVHALQKGTVKPGKASKAAQSMAKSMNPEDVTAFAATKHKGLPKKVKKENMGVASMYVVRKPHADMKEADLVMELNPLEGIQPLNIEMSDVHSVHATAEDAQQIAAEVYKKCMDEAFQLEEKKGKVGDKLKKAIDQLEKKRKEHVDMAKEDPKNASKHKEHIAKIATQIDDLMSKMEKIEKSKKAIEKKEVKEVVKEASVPPVPPVASSTSGLAKAFRQYAQDVSSKSGISSKEIQGIERLIQTILSKASSAEIGIAIDKAQMALDSHTKNVGQKPGLPPVPSKAGSKTPSVPPVPPLSNKKED
jgi:hypothetical protein